MATSQDPANMIGKARNLHALIMGPQFIIDKERAAIAKRPLKLGIKESAEVTKRWENLNKKPQFGNVNRDNNARRPNPKSKSRKPMAKTSEAHPKSMSGSKSIKKRSK